MPKFAYEAVDGDGKTSTGVMPADTSAGVFSALSRQGLTAVSIHEADDSGPAQEAKAKPKKSAAPAEAVPKVSGDLHKAKVKSIELMVFTRQLAVMVDAGLPIDQALETLASQAKSEQFQAVLYSILKEIRRGTRISQALEPYKKIFPDVYVTMVHAAEASGELSRILNQLAGYMEAAQRVKQKVKAALTYPVIATVMIVAVAGIMMFVVVPKFAKIFELVEGELPLPTRIVLAISNFCRANIAVSMLLVVSVIVAFVITLKTKQGRFYFDMFKLKVPIFGDLFTKVAVAKFARTLSTLLSSGVPILDALAIVERASGNAVIGAAVSESIGSVSGGSGLAEVFETKEVLPAMLVKMIAVGEQTGQLDSLLDKVADFYNERVEAAIEGLTAMIEPLLIGFLGLIVGGIVVAIFLPMIKLTQSM